MKKWTEEELNKLPVENGFRLRGFRMTRLETLTDAAFAFAITMLVISIGKIPGNLDELIAALKTTPALILAFSMIFLFWSNHRTWSRNYGLENFLSQLITFGLIFIFLVYVYPLRLMASLLMSLLSSGYFPSEFIVHHLEEIPKLFVIYGFGFTFISALFSLLFYQGWIKSEILSLNKQEKVDTKIGITSWAICSITGLIAIFFSAVTPPYIGVFSGFIYSTLPMTVSFSIYRIKKYS
ncbi:uncharacterized protein METZ01_LOCUS153157 [marine metagenome]|uniref:DUF1211 domain-containing protein n=1 Tax=marine metagenome TaxID=408172 RepID=A0A382AH46_9ZZZZ